MIWFDLFLIATILILVIYSVFSIVLEGEQSR